MEYNVLYSGNLHLSFQYEILIEVISFIFRNYCIKNFRRNNNILKFKKSSIFTNENNIS
jgi:hypothetical protein